jgi:hypothetical protein
MNMTRNLRALGLTLAAAFTFSATVAQAASAHQFFAEGTPTVLTGGQIGENVFKFGGEFKCTTTTFAGTQTGLETDTITIHPTYGKGGGKCSIAGIITATVTTTGCNYVFGSDTATSPDFTGEHAAVSVECESGKAITIAGSGCAIKVGGNTVNQGLGGVIYKSEGTGANRSVELTMALRTIHYEASGLLCGLAGVQTGTHADAAFDGVMTVKGFVDNGGPSGTEKDEFTEGAQRGIWVE